MGTTELPSAFLPFSDETFPRVHNYQAKIVKLCELTLIISKTTFMGVGKPNFRENKWENRARTGKAPNPPGV